MRLRLRTAAFTLLLAVCTLLPRPAAGQSSDTALPPADGLTDVEQVIRKRVDDQKTHAGIVVGVVDAQGRRTFAYGIAGEGARADVRTVFEIGSLTKVFTGLLLADAVERGAVDLGAPVESELPVTVNLPAPDGREITFRHLVTHTSGLPRLPLNLDLGEAPDDPYATYGVADLYQTLNQVRLWDEPGDDYAYSNVGYGLLGHALARAEEADYTRLIDTRILEPLGMTSTRFALTRAVVDTSTSGRLATGHDAARRAVPYWHFTDAFAGAGALQASAEDLLAFLEAQLGLRDVDGRLAAAIARSHHVLHEDGSDGQSVAYGWHVRHLNGRRYLWHNGGTGGFSSFMAFDPRREIGVVVLSNSARSVDDLGFRLLDQKADLEKPFNTHRRFSLEAGLSTPVDGAAAPHVRASWMFAIDPRAILRVRPFAEYNRFGLEGTLADSEAESQSPMPYLFDAAGAGLMLEYSDLFSFLLRWAGVSGEIFGGVGARANYAFRVTNRTTGESASNRTSRWSFQLLGSKVGYRRGPFFFSFEGWGHLRYFGDEKPVDRVGDGEQGGFTVGYTF